jgi:hypothetical protein
MYNQIDHKVLSKNLLIAHNNLRSDPISFIEKIEKTMKQLKGNILSRPMEFSVQTIEGKNAFLEAIEFLKKQKPIPKLKYDERLSKSSDDHIKDLGPKGIASHDGSDGSTVYDRIEKYCEWDLICSENIDLGGKTADDILVNLIVDDGVPNRGHRKNIFSPELKYFGTASGIHKDFGIITVINYTGGIRNLGEESPDNINFISDYCKRTMNKTGKAKINLFQKDDLDAPDNTVAVKILKSEKMIKNKKVTITKKIYTLDDGSQFILEIEDD